MTIKKFQQNVHLYMGTDACDCLSSVRAREMYADSFGTVRGSVRKNFHLLRNHVVVECQECAATWLTWEQRDRREYIDIGYGVFTDVTDHVR